MPVTRGFDTCPICGTAIVHKAGGRPLRLPHGSTPPGLHQLDIRGPQRGA